MRFANCFYFFFRSIETKKLEATAKAKLNGNGENLTRHARMSLPGKVMDCCTDYVLVVVFADCVGNETAISEKYVEIERHFGCLYPNEERRIRCYEST